MEQFEGQVHERYSNLAKNKKVMLVVGRLTGKDEIKGYLYLVWCSGRAANL